MFELTTTLSVFAIIFQTRFRICVLMCACQLNPLEVVDPSTQCYIACVSNTVTCTANHEQPTLAIDVPGFFKLLQTGKIGSRLRLCKIDVKLIL